MDVARLIAPTMFCNSTATPIARTQLRESSLCPQSAAACILGALADPAGRFGGGGAPGRTSTTPNLGPTYPQIRVSPRISTTLFRKCTKIQKKIK